MKIIMPTGILYKNIQRQLKYSVRIPPNIGPKAIDETPIVAAIDNIKGISLGLKRMYILAIIMGIIAPPKIPCSPLKNVINKKDYNELKKKYFGKPKLIQMDLFDPKKKKQGGLMEATRRLKAQGLRKGGKAIGTCLSL